MDLFCGLIDPWTSFIADLTQNTSPQSHRLFWFFLSLDIKTLDAAAFSVSHLLERKADGRRGKTFNTNEKITNKHIVSIPHCWKDDLMDV